MLFVCHPKILHKHGFQFLLGVKMAPRETENNAFAKFWGDKQGVLWYVMIFSRVVNYALARYCLVVNQAYHCNVFHMPKYPIANDQLLNQSSLN